MLQTLSFAGIDEHYIEYIAGVKQGRYHDLYIATLLQSRTQVAAINRVLARRTCSGETVTGTQIAAGDLVTGHQSENTPERSVLILEELAPALTESRCCRLPGFKKTE